MAKDFEYLSASLPFEIPLFSILCQIFSQLFFSHDSWQKYFPPFLLINLFIYSRHPDRCHPPKFPPFFFFYWIYSFGLPSRKPHSVPSLYLYEGCFPTHTFTPTWHSLTLRHQTPTGSSTAPPIDVQQGHPLPHTLQEP